MCDFIEKMLRTKFVSEIQTVTQEINLKLKVSRLYSGLFVVLQKNGGEGRKEPILEFKMIKNSTRSLQF